MGLFEYDPEVMAQIKAMSQPSEEEMKAARGQAILATGLGMMANSTGPRGANGLGRAIGLGGMQGMDAYQSSLMQAQRQRQNEMGAMMQYQKMKRDSLNLPAGMQLGEDGKPTWIPGYLEGHERLRQQAQQPYFTPLSTPQGVIAFDARTGQATPLSVGGVPVMKATDDPVIQGKIAGSREKAKSEVELGVESGKTLKRSNTLLDQAEEARKILDMNPTSSGIGAMVDAAGRAVGVSSKSAQDAAKLEAISGWMVSNVPRMEGPQSNFDVENYRTMAGKVGDRTVPIPERKAALQTLVELQNKYKHLNGGDQAGPVSYPSNAGLPGVKVPVGNEGRAQILAGELQAEQQRLAEARKNGDLKGISEANRNIELLNKEIGAKSSLKKEAPSGGFKIIGVR